MLFIPFRADIQHFRFPFLTLVVCLVCIGIYYGQYWNEQKVVESGTAFCKNRGSVMWRMVMEKTIGEASPDACAEILWSVHLAEQPEESMDEIARQGGDFPGLSAAQSQQYKRSIIAERYRDFQAVVPQYETQQLWYHPHSWNPWHMITATFAHGSWMHVIGNLFFFVAFAATVEVILGTLLYSVVITVLTFGTNIFYSLAMFAVPDAVPTVGLSGVVLGMMAMFAFFLPHGRIKCFLWFLIIVRVIAIPAWLLVLWYAGWDAYELLTNPDSGSGVNLVAHVSGAGIGYLLGFAFFRQRRQEIREWA